jgi:2-aminobenzoate-CoA ligase
MLDPSALVDTFARDRLSPPELWPELRWDALPDLAYPKQLNAATELLDRMVETGLANRPCARSPTDCWSYARLLETANRIAHVLVDDMGLVSGNRVLLRAANTPMLAACWYAVLKAGGIVVATMPLLRARELATVIGKAGIRLALCDGALGAELEAARGKAPSLERIVYFHTDAVDGLEAQMARRPAAFDNVATSHDDVALIAFTSGTTGQPKGTVHFHRDLLAVCDTFSKHVLRPAPDDVFCGSPPLAFTFGLGGLLLFPMRAGAATLLLEKTMPEVLLETIQDRGVTITFTAPTMYRQMAELAPRYDLQGLRKCVSAGEALPLAVSEAFHKATGIRIIDGIGSTEMLHIFISAAGGDIRPGSTGKPVPGYEARVVDEAGRPLPAATVGRLAVKGPTGCRYLDDPRQANYVQNGWNITGDAYLQDADGYFWYQARTDDMIVSAGYNIAGPEVEAVLLDHAKVLECAVIGAPDEERGNIVKAFVVLRDAAEATPATTRELQEWVKAQIAPYKYPRAVEYIAALPRTETGKIRRFRLRELERDRAAAGAQREATLPA